MEKIQKIRYLSYVRRRIVVFSIFASPKKQTNKQINKENNFIAQTFIADTMYVL